MKNIVVGRSEGVAYPTYQIKSISEDDINKFSQLVDQSSSKLSVTTLNEIRQKLFICDSKIELNKIVESAENLLLQYTVTKYHEKLWHVSVVLS